MALKLKSMRAAVSAAVLMIAITGPAAHAAPLLFTVTGASSGSWLQDSDPTPIEVLPYRTTVSVTGGTGDYFGKILSGIILLVIMVALTTMSGLRFTQTP